MKLICEGRCSRGALRQTNQDNLFVNGLWREDINNHDLISFSNVAEEGVYAVCDGMGGERYGEEASHIAARALAGIAPKDFFTDGPKYLSEMNQSICRLMRGRSCRIGTTFVGLSVWQGQGRIINVGDSRAYLLRFGRLIKLSRDHTQAQRLLDMELITQEQAATHPDRHKLTQHLGIFQEEMIIEPFLYDLPTLCRGDFVLLCSDGLTDALSDREIAWILMENTRLKTKANTLHNAAMKQGGKDNITVLLVQIL